MNNSNVLNNFGIAQETEAITYASVTHSSLIHALITFSALISCFSFLFIEKKIEHWEQYDDEIILSTTHILKQYTGEIFWGREIMLLMLQMKLERGNEICVICKCCYFFLNNTLKLALISVLHTYTNTSKLILLREIWHFKYNKLIVKSICILPNGDRINWIRKFHFFVSCILSFL